MSAAASVARSRAEAWWSGAGCAGRVREVRVGQAHALAPARFMRCDERLLAAGDRLGERDRGVVAGQHDHAAQQVAHGHRRARARGTCARRRRWRRCSRDVDRLVAARACPARIASNTTYAVMSLVSEAGSKRSFSAAAASVWPAQHVHEDEGARGDGRRRDRLRRARQARPAGQRAAARKRFIGINRSATRRDARASSRTLSPMARRLVAVAVGPDAHAVQAVARSRPGAARCSHGELARHVSRKPRRSRRSRRRPAAARGPRPPARPPASRRMARRRRAAARPRGGVARARGRRRRARPRPGRCRRSTMPMRAAAAYERSMMRFEWNGPRSLMRTTTDLPGLHVGHARVARDRAASCARRSSRTCRRSRPTRSSGRGTCARTTTRCRARASAPCSPPARRSWPNTV